MNDSRLEAVLQRSLLVLQSETRWRSPLRPLTRIGSNAMVTVLVWLISGSFICIASRARLCTHATATLGTRLLSDY
ncbi:MAG: hypothetical protein EAZ24_03695 [Burkholderiales bacterium]|nr:MAG: hypothetical protein EAZ24_03695 [Burkholderiales bacterium]TAG84203.1 MAG: hypothetical protein EAZ21_00895 [Betaproteobacteria bacterium]